MRTSEPFPALLRAFFYEWLAEQRNASIHTVRSYRDTWRLFLRFVTARKGGRVAQITLADLTASEVSAFLSHAEHERRGTIGTRSWLGHVSLDTTNHYAQANLETKRKALERVGAPTPSGKQPPWKRDASVLAWLDTL